MKNNKWFIPILIVAVNALAVIVKWSSLPELLPAHLAFRAMPAVQCHAACCLCTLQQVPQSVCFFG